MRLPPPKPLSPRQVALPKGMMYGPDDTLIPIPPKKGGVRPVSPVKPGVRPVSPVKPVKGGVRPKDMAYGGMTKKGMNKGGMANCGASMKPAQGKGK